MSLGWAGWCGGMLVFAGGWLNLGGGRRDVIHAPRFLAWNCGLAWAPGRPVDTSAKWGSGVLSNAALAGWWNRSPPEANLHDNGTGRTPGQVHCAPDPCFVETLVTPPGLHVGAQSLPRGGPID